MEDEPLIGMALAMSLKDAGAHVDGPLPSVRAALSAIEARTAHGTWTVALLDYRLGEETSEPIARRLCELGVSILFHTGSLKSAELIAIECDCGVLTKPSSDEALVEALVATQGP